jgi:hypothetical protein
MSKTANKHRRKPALSQGEIGGVIRPPEITAKSSQQPGIAEEVNPSGSRIPIATPSRENAPQARTTANDEVQGFDVVTRPGSRRTEDVTHQSDENRRKESARGEGTSRSREKTRRSDDNHSEHSVRVELTRHSEIETRRTPRSSERGRNTSPERVSEEQRSQNSLRSRKLGESPLGTPRRMFVVPRVEKTPTLVGRVWDTFEEPEQRGEGSRRREKQREEFPRWPPRPPRSPESPARQETRKDAQIEVFRSKVKNIRREVKDLDDAFNTTIEYLRYGAELGRQTVKRKEALNEEFSALLELLEDKEKPTRPVEVNFRQDRLETACEPRVELIPEMTVYADRRLADLQRRQKAGLLTEEEQRELARRVNWTQPRDARDIKKEPELETYSSSAEDNSTSPPRRVTKPPVSVVIPIAPTRTRTVLAPPVQIHSTRTRSRTPAVPGPPPVVRSAMLGGPRDLSKPPRFRSHGVSNPSVHGAGT